MASESHIRIILTDYPGYGGQPVWEVRVVIGNYLLQEASCESEYRQGRCAAELKAKWEDILNRKGFAELTKNKPLASNPCDICGKDTLDGCSSCVEKTFCNNCEHLIPKYREKYLKAQSELKQKYEDERIHRILEGNGKVQEAIRGAFHWRDNWFWRRLPDGSVRIMKHIKDGYPTKPDIEYLQPDLIIPENEWASIVSYVSCRGETGETWQAALDFHSKREVRDGK